MDTSTILLTFINALFLFTGIISLFLAYRIFIKKRKSDTTTISYSKRHHFFKDAFTGTFFFFAGCILFACTLTDIPYYLHHRIKAPKLTKKVELTLPSLTGNEDDLFVCN